MRRALLALLFLTALTTAPAFSQRFAGDDLQANDFYGQPPAILRMQVEGNGGGFGIRNEHVVDGYDWFLDTTLDGAQHASIHQFGVEFDVFTDFGNPGNVELNLNVRGWTEGEFDMNPHPGGSDPNFYLVAPLSIEKWHLTGTYRNRDYVNELDWSSGFEGATDLGKPLGSFASMELGYDAYPNAIDVRTAKHFGPVRETITLLIESYLPEDGWQEPLWLEPDWGITGFELSTTLDGTLLPPGAEAIMGDSNHDGRFNSSDLVAVFIAGEYQDAIDGNSVWETGDWNLDGDFDSSDLVAAFAAGTYESTATAMAVPEPSTALIAVIAVCSCFPMARRNRHR